MTGIDEVQAAIMAHKRLRGFNTEDFRKELLLTIEEIGELHRAWRLGYPEPDLRGEAADVIIFALSLAPMAGYKASEVVAEKMAVNRQREYRELPNGEHVKA